MINSKKKKKKKNKQNKCDIIMDMNDYTQYVRAFLNISISVRKGGDVMTDTEPQQVTQKHFFRTVAYQLEATSANNRTTLLYSTPLSVPLLPFLSFINSHFSTQKVIDNDHDYVNVKSEKGVQKEKTEEQVM